MRSRGARARLLAVAVIVAAAPAFADDYVVLAAPSRDPGFRAAAAKLASRHQAQVLDLDPSAPEKLLPALRKLAPRWVALVMPPEAIELGFQRRFLSMATRLDDDPFVDFAFGYVTGATGDEALAFVEACAKAADAPRTVAFGRLSGGADASEARRDEYRLRTSHPGVTQGRVKGDDKEHDRAFVASFLPALSKCSAIELVGHGYPDQVVGALDADDVKGLRLDGSVVLDVACWTGVTRTWYRPEAGRVVRDEVPAERSLALALLRTGLCGYTAYLGPRPMGPELDRDLMALVAGSSLGDARRRDYDKTVLGHLGYGRERMELEAVPPQGRDAVRDVMLEDAAGGVLFGDPALVPFLPLAGEDPVEVREQRTDAGVSVEWTCPRELLGLHCADPTGRIGGKSAMKVHARVALGDVLVADVVAQSVRLGARDVESRVVWAVEDDHGERFLQVKVMFPRQSWSESGKDDDLSVAVTVERAADAASARRSGGGEGGADAGEELRAAAARRKVSPEAMQAAVTASAALAGGADGSAKSAIDALAKFDGEGFRAVCVLLELGRSNHRAPELIAATCGKGDERLLLELASKSLPNHADWTVLVCLGATKSDAARRYLLGRLGTEHESGLFLSAAKGLALMKERAAAATVGERLLAFEASWSGVERPLVEVLGTLGGTDAEKWLRRYAADPRAAQAARARELAEKMR